MINAILLKPLNGQEVGSTVELSQQDFDYLEGLGAVRAAAPVEEDAKPARKPGRQAKS